MQPEPFVPVGERPLASGRENAADDVGDYFLAGLHRVTLRCKPASFLLGTLTGLAVGVLQPEIPGAPLVVLVVGDVRTRSH